ncbi:MAG TPA: hypothetical protein VFS21_27430 [Roseiflexaceae bacterium]|nr:hypothetical protein [Roseiflexaceae bacterium]
MRNRLLVIMLIASALAGIIAPAKSVTAQSSTSTTIPLWETIPLADAVRQLESTPINGHCVSNVTIFSAATSRYVVAEVWHTGGSYGMLSASRLPIPPSEPWEPFANGMLLSNTYQISTWALFVICKHDSFYTLRSQQNGQYVVAELNYSGYSFGMLRANATQIGPWEEFHLHLQPDGWVVIQSRFTRAFVSAEAHYYGDQYGMLRARAYQLGPWELFR